MDYKAQQYTFMLLVFYLVNNIIHVICDLLVIY